MAREASLYVLHEAEILEAVSVALLARGRYPEAATAFEVLILIGYATPEAMLLYALALAETGRTDAAQEVIATAVALESDLDHEVDPWLAELAKMVRKRICTRAEAPDGRPSLRGRRPSGFQRQRRAAPPRNVR